MVVAIFSNVFDVKLIILRISILQPSLFYVNGILIF